MSLELVGVPYPQDGREYDCQCARCGSSLDWADCGQCGGDGVLGHDCGEDTCCCLEADENVTCSSCGGEGGFRSCLSSAEWCEAHPMSGREDTARGTVEWFAVNGVRDAVS